MTVIWQVLINLTALCRPEMLLLARLARAQMKQDQPQSTRQQQQQQIQARELRSGDVEWMRPASHNGFASGAWPEKATL